MLLVVTKGMAIIYQYILRYFSFYRENIENFDVADGVLLIFKIYETDADIVITVQMLR